MQGAPYPSHRQALVPTRPYHSPPPMKLSVRSSILLALPASSPHPPPPLSSPGLLSPIQTQLADPQRVPPPPPPPSLRSAPLQSQWIGKPRRIQLPTSDTPMSGARDSPPNIRITFAISLLRCRITHTPSTTQICLDTLAWPTCRVRPLPSRMRHSGGCILPSCSARARWGAALSCL